MSPLAQLSKDLPRFPPIGADVEDLRGAWRDASEDQRLAYRDWCEADSARAGEAYCVYVAGADREAAAAEVLARWTARSET